MMRMRWWCWWSPRSLESAWVRDEAAEGRDRGKLVPISVEGVSPPMGFRQFQTLNFGAWKGRGKVPKLEELLEAVESQAALATPAEPLAAPPPTEPAQRSRLARQWILPVAVLALLAMVGAGAWVWLGRDSLPVVEVAPANSSPRSQAAASDLFVKLGSLAAVGEGKWQLVDASSAPRKPISFFAPPTPALLRSRRPIWCSSTARTTRYCGRASSSFPRVARPTCASNCR